MINEKGVNINQILPPTVDKKEIVFRDGMDPLLFLLEIDPYHFYAYWEISPEELSVIINQMGDSFHQSRLILRIYEGSERENLDLEIGSYFDIPVQGWKNKWYIEISKPNIPYYAELGLKPSTLDEFYLIKRSNVIKTPQNTVSSNKQVQWMQVLGEYESVEVVKPERVSAGRLSSARPSPDRKMIEEYYSNLSQKGWEESRPGGPGKDRTTGQDEPVKWLEPLSEDAPLFFPESIEPVSAKNYNSSFLGFSSFSSPGSWQPEENVFSNSFFHYDVDLVIYGKTQPEAALYIDGDAVEIRPDGTFSCRLNLSREGAYRIPLQVVLQGGEKIFEVLPFHIRKAKKNGD